MKAIKYAYLFHENQPAWYCPECGKRWNKHGGVEIILTVSCREVVVPSLLDERGELVDTPDEAVAKGFHSQTICSGCDDNLCELVEEMRYEVEEV